MLMDRSVIMKKTKAIGTHDIENKNYENNGTSIATGTKHWKEEQGNLYRDGHRIQRFARLRVLYGDVKGAVELGTTVEPCPVAILVVLLRVRRAR